MDSGALKVESHNRQAFQWRNVDHACARELDTDAKSLNKVKLTSAIVIAVHRGKRFMKHIQIKVIGRG